MCSWWGRIVVVAGIALGLTGAAEAKRIALVIGNKDYVHLTPLQTATGDAHSMKATLERLGFAVTLAQNLDYAGLLNTFATFEATVDGGDEVVVHFSGHGVSVNGRNYLLPIDMKEPTLPSLVPGFSRDAGDMVEGIRARQPRFVFAILDACRNNPFSGPVRSAALSRGLTRMQADAGAFILFSAGPGEAALDRLPGERAEVSVFTRVLLKHLETAGLSLQDIAELTKDEVRTLAATYNNHQQFPDYSARVFGRPVLKPATSVKVETPAEQTQAEADIAYRVAMLDSSDAALIDFARRFPNDPRAVQVLDLVEKRKQPQQQAAIQPPPQITPLPVPIEATGTLLRTFTGHTHNVNAVAYSPDGRHLASGSDDKTVKLWDAASGALIKTLQGHTNTVTSVAYSPDGRRLASGSTDNTVKLWDAALGVRIKTLQEHRARVYSVAYSPDGRRLASASYDDTVKLWDAALGALIQTLQEQVGGISFVRYSPDGRHLASEGDDNTVKLWDAASGALIKTLQGNTTAYTSVGYSPDGRRLASGGHDNTVKLWDVASGELIQTLKGHTNTVTCVAYSPDGRLLASGSWDNTVKLWDAASGELLQTLKGHRDSVYSVAYSPDGRHLASGSGDDTVKLWAIDAYDPVSGR